MNKILVVEDELNVRENITEILESYQFRVESAGNGREALGKMETFFPDLIISDIMMPVMDGYGFQSECRNNPNYEDIPFIFLSAKSQSQDIRLGMASGAEDYITKPFRAADLISAITIRIEKKEKSKSRLDRIKKDIARYVPHELRTPLISILGFSELILTESKTLSEVEILEMVGRINRAGKRLHSLVEKFILFSDLELKIFDKAELEALTVASTLDFDHSVEMVAMEKANYYDRKDDLVVNVERVAIKGEKYFAETVLREIIDNSFKFSIRGSKVEISGVIAGGYYLLKIKDSGYGFDVSNINSIESFTQFNRKALQQTGLGLGIVIAKKIITIFSGSIMFTSEEGRYTLVEIKLPVINF